MSKKKPIHHFRCIKGVAEFFEKDQKEGNVLSFKNEVWKVIDADDTGYQMECVEGPNEGWEFSFTLKQMAECFEWIPNYDPNQDY